MNPGSPVRRLRTREFGECTISHIDSGQGAREIAGEALEPRQPTTPSVHPGDVTSGDQTIKCWDIQQAAERLKCSVSTLRRYDKAHKIRFVPDGVY
jgi:hypothetical protein